jgi:3-hydroxyisobutyrate dehydrogenase-like beta-hydroxyacid dehydrogenase
MAVVHFEVEGSTLSTPLSKHEIFIDSSSCFAGFSKRLFGTATENGFIFLDALGGQ